MQEAHTKPTLGPPFPWGIACGLIIFAAFAFKIIVMNMNHGVYVEDDAYYYIITAKNISAEGLSSFDGQSLTNGYHPLWMLFLVVQILISGPSIFLALLMESALLSAGLVLFIRRIRPTQGAASLAFALIFVILFTAIGLDGMEVALLICCVGLFVNALAYAIEGGARGWFWLGLAAAACVGARIDSAFFITPALIAAPLSRRDRAAALGVLIGFAAVYASWNLAMFGTALPISSTIKSLGGAQINHPLLTQLDAPLDPRRHVRGYYVTFAALIASPALLALSRRGSLARVLSIASVVGGLIYVVKLLLLSSWVVWPWYNFAVLFPLLSLLYASTPWIGRGLGWLEARWPASPLAPLAVGRVVAAGICLIALAALAIHLPLRRENGFATINRMAARRFASQLNGGRVAMGDRAGSFAMAYGGPVVQLEGLVNDKTYLDLLRRSGDVHGLLCRRGVKALASYERDLGPYHEARVPLLRPNLTQFPSPVLSVRRSEEIGHIGDPSIYESRGNAGVGDDILYLWRLRCP